MGWTAPRTASNVPRWSSLQAPSGREPSVGKSIIDTSSVTRVGLDLAKRVFRIHAVDATGSVIIARSVNRRTLFEVFRRASAVRRGDGGMRLCALLGAAIAGTRLCGEAHPAGAREARSLPSGVTRGSGATRTTQPTR